MAEPGAMRRALPWLALTLAAFLVLAYRLQLSYDLGLFLPQGGTLEQQVVVEQLTSGPGSRLLLIGLAGADRDVLAEAGRALRDALAANPAFAQVQNGETGEDVAGLPPTVWRYRFLLTDLDWSVAGLRDALDRRLRDLAFGGGPELVELIAADPYLAAVATLERLAPATLDDRPWFTADGVAVVLAETTAPASDIAAQQRALAAVHSAVEALDAPSALQLEVTGPGAFGVELQHTIRAEAEWRSALAVGGLLLVLLLAYRRPRLMLIAGIPLGFGFLCGLAVTALLFGTVHGITLAFGFTLLGIAIDFPLHLFSHSRHAAPGAAMRRIWPTLRTGAASTLLAYLALALSGSPGLAQLGTFTAAGLVGAVAVTRFWLPHLLPANDAPVRGDDDAGHAPRPGFLPALVALALTAVGFGLVTDGSPWHDAPESLSPVPAERLAADQRLRSALASIDLRYQLAVPGASVDEALEGTERLERELPALHAAGLLADWRAVTQLAPSRATQQDRRQRIPEPSVLAARLNEASAASPFDAAAFAPFLDDAAMTRTLAPVRPEAYRDGPLAGWVSGRLVALDDGWVSLVSVIEPEPERLHDRLAARVPEAQWIDLKRASAGLFAAFRNGVLQAIGIASLLMLVLLALQRLRARRILWLVATVAAALAATALAAVALHGQLTIIHLVALLLVFGLGLDYALFFSRAETRADRRDTLHSVTACTASTLLAFGILGASSVPFLHYVGTTTAIGSLLSFVLAFAGSRRFS